MSTDPEIDRFEVPPPPPRASVKVSWAALLLPLIILVGCTIYIVDYLDARSVPAGTAVQHAKVIDKERRRVSSDYTALIFETDTGERGRVIIDRGDPVPHEIDVYRDGDNTWKTTSAKSTFRFYGAFLGYPLALVLIIGWFVLRRRAGRSGTTS